MRMPCLIAFGEAGADRPQERYLRDLHGSRHDEAAWGDDRVARPADTAARRTALVRPYVNQESKSEENRDKLKQAGLPPCPN
jgi:hypothetical protein